MLSGKFTTEGVYTFTLTATDSVGATGASTLTVTIGPGVTIFPLVLPPIRVGVPFSQQISGSGGTGARYTIQLTTGAPIPGITFNFTTRVLSGTPTTAGPYSRGFRVIDSNGNQGDFVYSGTVLPASDATVPPVITVFPSTLPVITVGVPFSQQITASGGTGPYTWQFTTGAQIPGLSFNTTTAVLSGTPTTAGPYSRGLRVTDSAAHVTDIVYSGTVLPAGVPTMPQWMLIAFAVLLIGIAVRRLSRPRMARL